MAHAYDTGLSIPQRTAIRNALIARLSPLLKRQTPPAPAKYLRAITTVARPLRGRGDDTGLQLIANALLGQAPAIAIALGKLPAEQAGTAPTEYLGELEVALYVVSEHNRDTEEGRLYGDAIAAADDTADPGIWTMLEHARERVAGAHLGIPSVEEPLFLDEDEVLTAANASVWEQRYSLRLTIAIDPARDVTELVTSIESRTTPDGVNPDGPPSLDPLVAVTPLDPEDP